jgi:hypothetical protein
MNATKTLLAISLAGAALTFSIGAQSRAAVDIEIAPPAAVVEDAPVRAGYVYAPGYWDWDDAHHKHVWHKGEYMHERHGEHWVPHKWEEHGGKYTLREGHWEHGDR